MKLLTPTPTACPIFWWVPRALKAPSGPPAPVTGLLLGYFGTAGNPTHVLVVNLDYTQDVTTTVVGPGPMEAFDAGHAPKVVLQATHARALDICRLEDLKAHAVAETP